MPTIQSARSRQSAALYSASYSVDGLSFWKQGPLYHPATWNEICISHEGRIRPVFPGAVFCLPHLRTAETDRHVLSPQRFSGPHSSWGSGAHQTVFPGKWPFPIYSQRGFPPPGCHGKSFPVTGGHQSGQWLYLHICTNPVGSLFFAIRHIFTCFSLIK